MASPPSLDQLQQVPAIPLDEDGAVFSSPWEAKVFALIVFLHQQGHFQWTEWAQIISDEIAKDRGSDPETPYYELWLRAAERIIAAKGLCSGDDLIAVKAALRAAQSHDHDHDHAHGHQH